MLDRVLRIPLVGLVTILIWGCEDSPFGQRGGCTRILQAIGVVVTDAAVAPQPDLSYETLLLKSGVRFQADSGGSQPYGGWYPVITDLEGPLLSTRDYSTPLSSLRGDSARFVATDGQKYAIGYFVLVHNGCHVEKLSGPDTLVLR